MSLTVKERVRKPNPSVVATTERVALTGRLFGVALFLILLVALAVRLAIIFGPSGELEADEAIVGLMALEILGTERPVFYWGQSYLGALEAYSAALAFGLFGPSTWLLKLVPTLYSLGFIVLSTLLARYLFGRGTALLTAAYLAVPPTMLALWSTKPRGGYAEVLFLGEAVLLLTLLLPSRRHLLPWSGALGLVAGLAFWTHQLAVIYLVPSAVYLALVLRSRARHAWAPCLVGLLIGASPFIVATAGGLETASALEGNATELAEAPRNLVRLWRTGIPVLMGLGQPTSDLELWQSDWPRRLAGNMWIAIAADGLFLYGLLRHRRSIAALARGQHPVRSGPALLLGLFAAALVVLPLTKFWLLVSEPRYALPLYALVPLFAAVIWSLRTRPALFVGTAGLVLALNIVNLATFEPRLALPTTAGGSSAATRAELLSYLNEKGFSGVYADYWLAYPLAFDARGEIEAAVMSNGFDRFSPYAHLVHVNPRPAFVLVRGSSEADTFYARMAEAGATGRVERVSIYDVVYDVQPLESVRP